VEDLFAEPFLDERRRHFARTEPRNARLAAVASRDAIDLRIDDVAGYLYSDAFLGLTDVGEFCFHFSILYRSNGGG
jgi:hypothetical protein